MNGSSALRWLLRALVVIVLAAAAAFAWNATRPAPVAVVLAAAEPGRVETTVANTRAGSVSACRRAKLATPLGGRIEKLAVREGDRVKQGQLLLVLWNDDLLARERVAPSWRQLLEVYRRWEAQGEIRGGRFVSGFGGEQFALADAVGRLRAVRKLDKSGELVALSGADPLNLVGIVTPEARVAGVTPNRVLFRDGLAIAALEGGELRRLAASEFGDDTLKTLFWRRSSALGSKSTGLSEASRKRWLERRVRVPLPG